MDIEQIVRRLGAKVKGKVKTGSGYLGALQAAALIQIQKKGSRKNRDDIL